MNGLHALDQICQVNGYRYSVNFDPEAHDGRQYQIRVANNAPRRVRVLTLGTSLSEAASKAHVEVHQS